MVREQAPESPLGAPRHNSWLLKSHHGLAEGPHPHILYAITVTPGGQATSRAFTHHYRVTGIMTEPLSPVARPFPSRRICREALLEKYTKDKEQTIGT